MQVKFGDVCLGVQAAKLVALSCNRGDEIEFGFWDHGNNGFVIFSKLNSEVCDDQDGFALTTATSAEGDEPISVLLPGIRCSQWP